MTFYLDPRTDARLRQERMRRHQTFTEMRDSVTPELALGLLNITQQVPSAPVGVQLGGAVAGATPQDVATLAQMDADQSGPLGFIGDALGWAADGATDIADAAWQQIIKPTVRTAFTLVDSFAQEAVQRPVTSALVAVSGQTDFATAYRTYGNSAGVEAVQGLLEGQELDGLLGDGIFAGGRAQEESNRQRTLMIEGEQATFGRAFANNTVGYFADPGTTAWNTAEFIMQLGLDVVADPTALALGGSKTLARRAGTSLERGRGATLATEGLLGARRARTTISTQETALIKGAVESGGSVRDAVGMVQNPWRKTLLTEKARALTENESVLQSVAGMDADEILKTIRKNPNISLTGEQIQRLATATDRDSVASLLGELAGTGNITSTKAMKGMGKFQRMNPAMALFYGTAGRRLRKFTGLSPAGAISPDDLPGSALRFDSLYRQAGVSDDLRKSLVNDLFALADEPSTKAQEQSFRKLINRSFEDLTEATGTDLQDPLRDMLRAYDNQSSNRARTYLRNESGAEIATKASRMVSKDGTGVQVVDPTPQTLAQLEKLSYYIDADTVREVRRAAEQNRVLHSVYNSRAWSGTEKATRFLTSRVFKPAVLLRPAYAMRELLDGQLRMTGANVDYDTMFSSPIRYMSMLVASRSDAGTFMGRSILKQAEDANIIAQDMHGILKPSMGTRSKDMLSTTKNAAGTPGHKASVGAWRWNIQHYAGDQGVRELARHNFDVEAWAQDWAVSGDGRRYFETLAGVTDEHAVYKNFDSPEAQEAIRSLGEGLRESLVGADGLGGIIGGIGTPVHEMFVNGGIDGLSLFKKADASKIETRLGKFSDELMPDEVWSPKSTASAKEVRQQERSFMDLLATSFMTKPSNYFTRYPALRQRLVKNSIDLLRDVDGRDMRATIGEKLNADFKLTKFEQKDLARAIAQGNKNEGGLRLFAGAEDTHDFEEIVKARSFSEALDDLFDIADRSAMQDSFGAIAPFYDAYVEAIGHYGRIAKQNPAFFVKGAQGYQSMREQGFFHVNDFGDEVFTMPGGAGLTSFVRRMNESDASFKPAALGTAVGAAVGSKVGSAKLGAAAGGAIGGLFGGTTQAGAGAAADVLTGNVPDDLVEQEARVQGLNIALNGVGPGFGPVVQWAAGAFLPSSNEFNVIREFVNPFGSDFTKSSDVFDPTLAVQALMPAWGSKVLNALSNGRLDPVQYNGMIGDALDVYASSDAYDPTDPEDRLRLEDDAKRAATFLLFVRGIAQGIAPTGPSEVWKIGTENLPGTSEWNPEEDPDGRYHSLISMGQEYRRLEDTYGDDAAKVFFDMYGKQPYYIAQGKTRSTSELPVTKEGQRWVDQHEEAARLYPSVVGYFAPQAAADEFDYSVWRKQLDEGDRQPLTAAQQLQMANQTRARQMFYTFKDKVEASGLRGAAKTALLKQVGDQLETEIPGWRLGVLGVEGGLEFKDRLTVMREAAFDDRLADSPSAAVLKRYFEARDKLLAVVDARTNGLSTNFRPSKDRDLLDALQSYGSTLSVQDQNFRGVWQSFLSRESD